MSGSTEQGKTLERAAHFARTFHASDASGHDWFHIERVVAMTRRLAAAEGADPFVTELAALLHDVADEKLNPSKEAGQRRVADWLEQEGLPSSVAAHVLDIIATMSFSEGGREMRTIEGAVVRDADRLDAIGAIAIARTFVYAGWKGHPIYDPAIPPRESMSREQYRSGQTTAVNHFYEKLLKLKQLLHTETARQLAAERHRFMERYLEQFHREWNGDV